MTEERSGRGSWVPPKDERRSLSQLTASLAALSKSIAAIDPDYKTVRVCLGPPPMERPTPRDALKQTMKLYGILCSNIQDVVSALSSFERRIKSKNARLKHKKKDIIDNDRRRMAIRMSALLDFAMSMSEVSMITNLEIMDDRIRYKLLYHCANIAESTTILGHVLRRDIFDEKRDHINGLKPKIKSSKSQDRQREIEKKMLGILKENPGSEWRDVWKKVHATEALRNLASRNTLEKDARAAYQKHFIEPPLLKTK